MILTSNVSMMTESNNGPEFVSNDITGDFERIDPPEDWREKLIEASRNTHGMTELTATDLGEESDWLWWVDQSADEQGYLTGIVTTVAQYAAESDARFDFEAGSE